MMPFYRYATVALLLALAAVAACTFQGPIRPEGGPVICVPATPTNPSFANDVFPIIQQNCAQPCHFTGGIGPFPLNSYAAIKQRVDEQITTSNNILVSSRLGNAINRFGQTTGMPYLRDKLPDCTLAIINNWIINGAPNN